MRTRRPSSILAAALLAGAVVGFGRAGQAEPTDERGRVLALLAEKDGAVAPADAWPMEGGCSARSATSLARPLRGALEVAWTFDVKGVVEEEPRVWAERCFVSERTADGKRVLHVLGSRDGVERYKQRFESPRALSPAVGPRDVVLHGDRGLEMWAVGERMLTRRWTASRAVRAFTRRGDTLYVVAEQSVTRSSVAAGPDRSSETYSSEHPLAPAIAVRGPCAYVVATDEQGNAELLTLSSVDLRRRQSKFAGNHPPGSFGETSIAAGATRLFVRAEQPLKTRSGASANTVSVDLSADGDPVGEPWLIEMPALPACCGSGFVGVWEGATKGVRELVRPAAERGKNGEVVYDLFATSKDRPALVAATVQPTVTGSVVILDGFCFDAESRDILREDAPTATEGVPAARAVPARDLLLVTSARRVTAYRETRPPPTGPGLALAAPAAAQGGPVALDGVAVALADGSVRSGSFAADLAAKTLTPAGKGGEKKSIRLDDALAIVSASAPRRLLFARDAASATTGLAAVADREIAPELLAAAKDALSAGAVADARRLAMEAAARDADEAAVTKVLAGADAAKPKAVDEKKAAAARAREAALLKRSSELLGAVVESLPADAPFALRTALLRAVLEREPGHPGAVAWIRSAIPPGMPTPATLNAEEWLSLAEAVHRAPVTLLSPPTKGEKDLSYQRRQFGSALFFWRQDLIAIESGPLLILTSVNSPARIAKCLAAGRQVCDVLETLCAGPSKRDTRYPLTHLLYESRGEYVDESAKKATGLDRVEAAHYFEATAGHYDSGDEMSRMFLPPDDREFERIVSTYAHELTHHWMDRRCPLFRDAEIKGGDDRGYWVVEGIAEYVSELKFDFAGDAPPTPSPRAFSLDVVAHAKESDLLEWARLFEMPHKAKSKLSSEPTIEVPMRWKLLWHRNVSPMNLFYAQACAASHYLLLAEEGKHRQRYLDYVADVYKGKVEKDAIPTYFGAAPDELGRRIVAWARARTESAARERR